MKTRRLFFTLTTLATVSFTFATASADEEGVIQITDQPSTDGYGIVMTAQELCGDDACTVADCNSCSPSGCDGCQSNCYADGYNARMNAILGREDDSFGSSVCRAWRRAQLRHYARNRRLSWCLVGWMVPTGNCGKGAPPLGCYDLTYAQKADYFDQRDGGVYGAAGYGMPMTVPLAPNVNYQFNYGWGTPSSRITPISNRQPYTKAQPIHW